MEMITYEFEGYVKKVNRTQWGVDVIVGMLKDEGDEKYPQRVLFSTSKKSIDKVPESLGDGDKVKVQFAPFLNEGVSQKSQRVYAINKNMIIKMEVTEIAERKPETEGGNDPDDMPF